MLGSSPKVPVKLQARQSVLLVTRHCVSITTTSSRRCILVEPYPAVAAAVSSQPHFEDTLVPRSNL